MSQLGQNLSRGNFFGKFFTFGKKTGKINKIDKLEFFFFPIRAMKKERDHQNDDLFERLLY
jgi:hypothetical protein